MQQIEKCRGNAAPTCTQQPFRCLARQINRINLEIFNFQKIADLFSLAKENLVLNR